MGGEEMLGNIIARIFSGLPPRGRGRVLLRFPFLGRIRITPAWAGKSVKSWIPTVSGGDYPRVGGEEAYDTAAFFGSSGLPPRGRGRVGGRMMERVTLRITPAWAGKSFTILVFLVLYRDYPRVGGEELLVRPISRFVLGLPPRGRGRVLRDGRVERVLWRGGGGFR